MDARKVLQDVRNRIQHEVEYVAHRQRIESPKRKSELDIIYQVNTEDGMNRYLDNIIGFKTISQALDERDQLAEENQKLKQEYEQRFHHNIGAITQENEELKNFIRMLAQYTRNKIEIGHEYIEFSLCRPLGKESVDMDMFVKIMQKYGGK